MRSHSVSVRRSCGAAPALLSLSKQCSFWRSLYAAMGAENLNRFKSDNSAHSCLSLQQQKFFAPSAPLLASFCQFFDLFLRTGAEIHSECRLSQPAIDSCATCAGAL